MFTGIIQGLGRVAAITPLSGEVELKIEADFDWGQALVLGESIAVSGVCLTVTRAEGRAFTAHVSAETMSRSNLGRHRMGDRVNLERALRLSDRLGGHLVSGHIDGLGVIRGRENRDRSLVFTFGLDKKLVRYLIEKGSVAVDGISLTVNQVFQDSFTVNIIPHTAGLTSLGFKKVGDYVNLETDLIGKYVARLLGRETGSSGIDERFLAEHGFLR
ncbi:MAG: riboflavin synthase [Proteobacteria bacterium]|nr:riboflavin synthase [Pseudomonadota bacterium]